MGVEGLPIIEAAPGHRVAIWIGSWDIEAFDTAQAAEQVFRRTAIEAIFRQQVFAAGQPKAAGWNDDVVIAAHGADRTVAVLDIDFLCKVDFEAYAAAVAAT